MLIGADGCKKGLNFLRSSTMGCEGSKGCEGSNSVPSWSLAFPDLEDLGLRLLDSEDVSWAFAGFVLEVGFGILVGLLVLLAGPMPDSPGLRAPSFVSMGGLGLGLFSRTCATVISCKVGFRIYEVAWCILLGLETFLLDFGDHDSVEGLLGSFVWDVLRTSARIGLRKDLYRPRESGQPRRKGDVSPNVWEDALKAVTWILMVVYKVRQLAPDVFAAMVRSVGHDLSKAVSGWVTERLLAYRLLAPRGPPTWTHQPGPPPSPTPPGPPPRPDDVASGSRDPTGAAKAKAPPTSVTAADDEEDLWRRTEAEVTAARQKTGTGSKGTKGQDDPPPGLGKDTGKDAATAPAQPAQDSAPDPGATATDDDYVYTRWGPERREDMDEPADDWEDRQKADWQWEAEEVWQEWEGVFYLWDGANWIKPRGKGQGNKGSGLRQHQFSDFAAGLRSLSGLSELQHGFRRGPPVNHGFSNFPPQAKVNHGFLDFLHCP
ncbi:hypothetical protein AK812_SmicGene28170, partial [Symbiodinium microadriaticum]